MPVRPLFEQNDSMLLLQRTKGLGSFIPAHLISFTVLQTQCAIKGNTLKQKAG
jgi:hypothetical protein